LTAVGAFCLYHFLSPLPQTYRSPKYLSKENYDINSQQFTIDSRYYFKPQKGNDDDQESEMVMDAR